ncbi:MAG: DUF5723 family protein [Bacteroidales bacterium]|jgi:hypothetical protein
MIGKTKYILILLFAIIIADVSAQDSQILYFMNLPQNHLLNPALRPSNSLYIGLPALSGINLNINNNFVNFSDVFMKDQPKDSIISFLHPDYNVDKFLAKIKDRNFIEPESIVQLFGLGFAVGKDSYIFLDINEHIDGNIVLPGDLFKLVLKGNEGFVGSKIDLSSLRGDIKYYREVGVGFSRNFTDKLRIGIKGKLLFGIADASIDNKSLGITVNDDYSHTFDANMAVNLSGPVNVSMDSKHNITDIVFDDSRFKTASGISDFFSGKKNLGLGLDIGATYDLIDRIVVSASVTDLGFIRWNKDITNLTAKNQFEFSGLNMLDVINGTKTIGEVGQDMLDSLKNAFVVSNSKKPFTTWLPFGVTLGGSYSVTEQFSVGLLSYTRIIGKQVREALTLSANLNLGNAFSTSLSYTAENHHYDNIGAGLAFRAGIVQFYLASDRIPIMWNKIKNDNSTIVIPANWNTVNLRLGMNLVFGNRVKKKNDKPMVLVE